MLGDGVEKEVFRVPLQNQTIFRQIDDMSEGLENMLSKFYAMAEIHIRKYRVD